VTLLGLVLISFVSFSSCKTGPKVSACIVDYKNNKFQCMHYKNGPFEMSFQEGHELLCSSPDDTNEFLKSCKIGPKPAEVTLCSYRREWSDFRCVEPDGDSFSLVVEAAENYFCLSPRDLKRVIERCKVD
jgi:hypothetical protein